MVRGEIRKMHQESCTHALAVRIEREKLHPARINADERLVGGRRQTRNRPVVTLGLARDGDAVLAVELENLQNFLCLRATKQLLKPRDVLEPQFQGLRALVAVAQVRLAFYPIALLLKVQKLTQ